MFVVELFAIFAFSSQILGKLILPDEAFDARSHRFLQTEDEDYLYRKALRTQNSLRTNLNFCILN